MSEPRTAGIIDRILLIARVRIGAVVEGNSMSPTLVHGDRVVAVRNAKPRLRDIVLARHPFKSSVIMIKRVNEIGENGRIRLKGDNPAETTDSDAFGSIAAKDIIGVIVSRFRTRHTD